MTLYFDDYGPAYTDTIGWISVVTNSMTYRLITSKDRDEMKSENSYVSALYCYMPRSTVHLKLGMVSNNKKNELPKLKVLPYALKAEEDGKCRVRSQNG